jgi:spermidine synthase
VLTALVLGAPTVLMGGTLPAAARAACRDDDPRRRRLAVLYGMNTLGAVTGSLLATFLLLEVFGTRATLWSACLVNALVALTARSIARRTGPLDTTPSEQSSSAASAAPAPFVLAAAAGVGLAFFLMEMVWYRMLGPVLGGSSFTFGLILASALFGIGVGGAGYAAVGSGRRATLAAFAATCTAEALLMALPYALGDRIAILAVLLRPFDMFGFYGLAAGWAVLTGIVVLPAAIVSGYQFSLLIALLGRGRENLGRQLGLAYAWNTAGSIMGTLAGGFGLLPLLGATGTWVAATVVLLALGTVAIVLGVQQGERRVAFGPALGCGAAAALLLATSLGPTAAWRHAPIGAGRVHFEQRGPTEIEAFLRTRRRAVRWSADGLESSVAIDEAAGAALVVNGKSDGHARGDAGTMVMGGLIGALLHPDPRSALVVGLGTGASAGWLAGVPSIERVDVVELERAVLHAAEVAAPVNRNMLHDPKVHITINDAREVLLTTPQRYDVIFSEPSNPFRAGVASLFTREFYQAAAQRLRRAESSSSGCGRWVDAQTVRTVYATIAGVFPWVETYQTMSGDLLLLASLTPVTHDVTALRARLAEPIYRQALALAWRTEGLEGLLARYVANPILARDIAAAVGDWVNTDDRTLIEFDFARSVGRSANFAVDSLRALAAARGANRPLLANGSVDWNRVEDQRLAMLAAEGVPPPERADYDAERRARVAALDAFTAGNLPGAARRGCGRARRPRDQPSWRSWRARWRTPATNVRCRTSNGCAPIRPRSRHVATALLAGRSIACPRPRRRSRRLRATTTRGPCRCSCGRRRRSCSGWPASTARRASDCSSR